MLYASIDLHLTCTRLPVHLSLRAPRQLLLQLRLWLLVCFGLLVLATPLLAFAWSFLSLFPELPSDQAMIDRFYAQRDDFTHVIELMKEHPSLIAMDERARSLPEWSSFVVALDHIHIEGSYARHNQQNIYLFVALRGISVSGSEKGYAYLQTPPANLVVEDVETAHSRDSETIYRHIQGNWYLYYEWT